MTSIGGLWEMLWAVPTLEGSDNFAAWEVMIIATLESYGAWKFVTGDAVPPVQDEDEKLYEFKARLEEFESQAHHARGLIFFSCSRHIQVSLAKLETAQECWRLLQEEYRPRPSLISKHILWIEFMRIQYSGDDMQAFGVKFRDSLARCVAAGIQVDPMIPVTNFISLVGPHFEHWEANIREQMRRDTLNVPSLELLIREAEYEWRRRHERPSAQLHVGLSSRTNKGSWIADSGAGQHFCNNKKLFREYIADPLSINTGAGAVISPGYGSVQLDLQKSDLSYRAVSLRNVRYLPTSMLNIISGVRLEQTGVYWDSGQSTFVIRSNGEEFARARLHDGLKVFFSRHPQP